MMGEARFRPKKVTCSAAESIIEHMDYSNSYTAYKAGNNGGLCNAFPEKDRTYMVQGKPPASAPQEIDISVEITVCGFSRVIIARITDTARKTAISILIIRSSFFSLIFFESGLIRSMVRTELEVRTSDESVDMEAESTRTITIPKSSCGSFSII